MFIALEGTDGSGKTEQFNRLLKRLKSASYKVATFDFPQYDKLSSYFVRQYLNGKYGGWKEVGPYRASVFYALDRFGASFAVRRAQKQRKICLSNRYVASNMGHQGAKITGEKELLKFLRWAQRFEYKLLRIPRPDISIILHMPAEVARELVFKKGAREYIGGKKTDIHEEDIKHLLAAERTYLKIAELFPKDFLVIECAENGKPLPPEEIHERVWVEVKKLL